MPGGITNKDGNFESSLDNVAEELDWVKKQIQKELADLQKDVQEGQIKKSFFEKKENKVVYNMDLVKKYLQCNTQKDDFQVNSAIVMATQIALESKGYEVGKIDGLLKNGKGSLSLTEQAIRKFQKENGLKVDGVPGKNTVKKILEKLGNITTTPQKPENNNSKGNNNSEEVEGNNLTQKELFALDIYNKGKVPTKKEIEEKGYDPKEIWNLVYNRELMEHYNNIIGTINKNTNSPKTKSEGVQQNDKKDNDTKNEDNNIEISKNIKPIIDKKSGNVKNLDDILETSNLKLPKLKARDVHEIGGLGNSMMHGFQRYGRDINKHFSHMIGVESASTTTHLKRFKSEDHVKQYHKANPNIKSFVLYFGGNTSNNEQTLNDLKTWSEWLSNAGIEPVLCTNIGVDSHISKDEKYKDVNGKRLEPLNNNIRKLVDESNGKYKLIDFAKVDDVIEMGSNKHPKSYALMHDIVYKCIEK